MKKFAMIALVVVLGVSALYACGGMSPAPAPADTNTAVPDLPSDSNPTTDLPNGGSNDTTTTNSDGTNGGCDGIGKNLEDKTSINELNNLSSDLPNNSKNQNSDGNFVSCVL